MLHASKVLLAEGGHARRALDNNADGRPAIGYLNWKRLTLKL
jgi:hypothetical protein